MKWAIVALLIAACGNDEAVTMTVDGGMDDDPLHVSDTPAPGSLDDLHARIIAKRCSGQPGLCHNGQFEPNLSTPAMTYAYLVRRPSLENTDRLRVMPNDPANSQFIDKIRNRNGVSTQMPLGGEPLEEADIQALEAWISAGALRSPGAMPAPVLNNPPKRPEIAIYNGGGQRLDGTGPVSVTVGEQLVLRHSVQDFETPDASIPFAAVLLTAADGRSVALNPGANDPSTGQTAYDATGPMGKGDLLDYQRTWTVPAMLPLWDRATGMTTNVAASGQTLSVLVVYVDQAATGIAVFDVGTSPLVIQ